MGIVTGYIAVAKWSGGNVETMGTKFCALFSIVSMTLGAIPRVLLTLDVSLGWGLPNLNYGFGSYVFWFAEAAGLSVTFGAYPLICIVYNFAPPMKGTPTPDEETLLRFLALKYR